MEKEDKVKVSDSLREKSASEIIKEGVQKMGTYHPMKPLTFDKEGNLISQRFRTLYFYHNRLENYGLEKYVNLTEKTPKKKLETVS